MFSTIRRIRVIGCIRGSVYHVHRLSCKVPEVSYSLIHPIVNINHPVVRGIIVQIFWRRIPRFTNISRNWLPVSHIGGLPEVYIISQRVFIGVVGIPAQLSCDIHIVSTVYWIRIIGCIRWIISFFIFFYVQENNYQSVILGDPLFLNIFPPVPFLRNIHWLYIT